MNLDIFIYRNPNEDFRVKCRNINIDLKFLFKEYIENLTEKIEEKTVDDINKNIIPEIEKLLSNLKDINDNLHSKLTIAKEYTEK